MKTQTSLNKPKILITGGAGDWAVSFAEQYKNEFEFFLPNRRELDVTDEQLIQAYFHDKSFDIVINNAGSIHPKRILESSSEKWINDINVNLIGTYLICKYALTVNPTAKILNVSSTAGFNAYADWSSYCASKAGVITLSKSLAADNFNVVCLCPGAILTKFRDYFDLPNDNAMTCEHFSSYVKQVIDGQFSAGDVLFIRKNDFVLNPK